MDDDTADGHKLNEATNVGAKFQFVFQILFFMTVIECVISLFAYSISKAVADKNNSEPVF